MLQRAACGMVHTKYSRSWRIVALLVMLAPPVSLWRHWQCTKCILYQERERAYVFLTLLTLIQEKSCIGIIEHNKIMLSTIEITLNIAQCPVPIKLC